jgi:hypothetical protein
MLASDDTQHSQHGDPYDQKYRERDDAFSDTEKRVAWPNLANEVIHLCLPFQHQLRVQRNTGSHNGSSVALTTVLRAG